MVTGSADEVLELLTVAHRLIYRLMFPLLREHGLAVTDAAVMKLVSGMGGGAGEGFRLTDLSRELGLPPSTLTAVIDRLESMGYLMRVPSPADRRSVLVRPTARWGEVCQRLQARREAELRAVLAALPPEQVSRLAADLAALVSVLKQRQSGSPPGEG